MPPGGLTTGECDPKKGERPPFYTVSETKPMLNTLAALIRMKKVSLFFLPGLNKTVGTIHKDVLLNKLSGVNGVSVRALLRICTALIAPNGMCSGECAFT